MTRICPHIISHSNALWHYLTDVFRFGLTTPEIGITNDLVYRIVSFYNSGFGYSVAEVYANNAQNEAVRGADIDLFIKQPNGLFAFFMLQAKVMNNSGRYNDIQNWVSNSQYHRLIRNASLENATPYYLLYNGLTPLSNLGSPSFGTAIVSAEKVRQNRRNEYNRAAGGRQNRATFNDLFPDMRPFSDLFCKQWKWRNRRTGITESDIHTGYPYVRIYEGNENREGSNERYKLDNPEQYETLGKYRIVIGIEKFYL